MYIVTLNIKTLNYQILYDDKIKLYAYLEHMVVSFVEGSAENSLLHQYGVCTKLFGLVW
jgi:hypothetical protein